MKEYTCTIVSHTHWDREWYLPFQVFRLRLVELVDTVLEVLGRDPDFRAFTLDGQAILLEDYLEVRPEREDELRSFVQAGRLLIGPWYVLPDEFLVSGEALIRNLILGRRICSRFGPVMDVGYTPDPFGHISQLPQILRGVGIDTAVFKRGLSEEPTILEWEAPDGSRVLTIYLREGYDNFAHLPDNVRGFRRLLQRQIDVQRQHSPVRSLLMMNGTDHMFPQPFLPRLIREAEEELDNVKLRHGTLPEFISDVRAEVDLDQLKVVRGELRSSQRHHLLPGVLSTRMWIKQRNARSQTLLERHAEPLAGLTRLLGGNDYRGQLRTAWRLLLKNHAHDSICGCSIDQVHEEMRPRFDGTDQIANEIAVQCLDFLARRIDTRVQGRGETVEADRVFDARMLGGGQEVLAVVVFNPVPGTATDEVSINVPPPPSGCAYCLRDDTGQAVPYRWTHLPETTIETWTRSQSEIEALLTELEMGHLLGRALRDLHFHHQLTSEHADMTVVLTGTGSPDMTALNRWLATVRARISTATINEIVIRACLDSDACLTFAASSVPGPGYRTFWLETVAAKGSPSVSLVEQREGRSIENEFFRIIADSDGSVTLHDKRTGDEFHGLHRFLDNGDAGDEYNHCPPDHDQVIQEPAQAPKIVLLEAGPLGQALQVQQILRLPTRLKPDRSARSEETVDLPIRSRIWLRPGVPRVDIETIVDNTAQDHRLRVSFPTGIPVDHVLAEGQFDILVRRPSHTGDGGRKLAGWAEQPVPTRPQCAYVAARTPDGPGLLIANRGLPEYEAREDGGRITLVLTLLRCVGWLSRDDFPCRNGQAGPQLATPGGQCIGQATFHYSLIPFKELKEAAREAHVFNAGFRAIAVPVAEGVLESSRPIVKIEPDSLQLTALKPSEDGSGAVLRIFNSEDEPVQARISFAVPVTAAQRVNLLEEFQADLTVHSNASLDLKVRGKEIVSIRVESDRSD